MMALMASSSSDFSYNDAPLEEIVFSCQICQATVSEVYKTAESNKGFHSGSGGEDGPVVRMWIASCTHITCSEHLEDGAVPFHPEGSQPQAVCPWCRTHGDASLKDLYAIRGLGSSERDQAIPDSWVTCPAIRLDGDDPEFGALRFQYIRLAHFSNRARTRWKRAEQKWAAAEMAQVKTQKQLQQVQSEVLGLRDKLRPLEKSEARLKKWEDRRPVINHYLGIVTALARDNDEMRGMLVDLGYSPPASNYAFNHIPTSPLSRHEASQPQDNAILEANAGDEMQSSVSGANLSSRKRKSDDTQEVRPRQDASRESRSRGQGLMLPPRTIPRQTYIESRPGATIAASRQDCGLSKPDKARNRYDTPRAFQENPMNSSHHLSAPGLASSGATVNPVSWNIGQNSQRYPENINSYEPKHTRVAPRRHDHFSVEADHLQNSLTFPSQVSRIASAQPYSLSSFNQSPKYGILGQAPSVNGNGQPEHRSQYFPVRNNSSSRQFSKVSQPSNFSRMSAEQQSLSPRHWKTLRTHVSPGQQEQPETDALFNGPVHNKIITDEDYYGPAKSRMRPYSVAAPSQAEWTSYDISDIGRMAQRSVRPRISDRSASVYGLAPAAKNAPRSTVLELEGSTSFGREGLANTSQELRDSQGLFQRPGRSVSLARESPSRLQHDPSLKRLSLRPNIRQTQPVHFNQEPLLARIPGVKGAISGGRAMEFDRTVPRDNALTKIFSSSSGRRSVKR